jgi:hypothetical protein
MIRTPALVPAAAALGLLAGLALEARAGTLQGEVSPHTVSVAWTIPGPTNPAGVELDERGLVPPTRVDRVTRLAPMRARVRARVKAERQAMRHIQREHAHRILVRAQGCPSQAADGAELRRS